VKLAAAAKKLGGTGRLVGTPEISCAPADARRWAAVIVLLSIYLPVP
jgi:hypothetical protein